jgi:hypothetical protein
MVRRSTNLYICVSQLCVAACGDIFILTSEVDTADLVDAGGESGFPSLSELLEPSSLVEGAEILVLREPGPGGASGNNEGEQRVLHDEACFESSNG